MGWNKSKISNTGEGPRHTMVGETGKFDKNGVLGGAPLSGADLDNDGSTSKGWVVCACVFVGGGGGGYRGIGLVEAICNLFSSIINNQLRS